MVFNIGNSRVIDHAKFLRVPQFDVAEKLQMASDLLRMSELKNRTWR